MRAAPGGPWQGAQRGDGVLDLGGHAAPCPAQHSLPHTEQLTPNWRGEDQVLLPITCQLLTDEQCGDEGTPQPLGFATFGVLPSLSQTRSQALPQIQPCSESHISLRAAETGTCWEPVSTNP